MKRAEQLQPPVDEDSDEVRRHETIDPDRVARVVAILQSILDNPPAPDKDGRP